MAHTVDCSNASENRNSRSVRRAFRLIGLILNIQNVPAAEISHRICEMCSEKKSWLIQWYKDRCGCLSNTETILLMGNELGDSLSISGDNRSVLWKRRTKTKAFLAGQRFQSDNCYHLDIMKVCISFRYGDANSDISWCWMFQTALAIMLKHSIQFVLLSTTKCFVLFMLFIHVIWHDDSVILIMIIFIVYNQVIFITY